MLFFTSIRLVVYVVMCVHVILHIKCIRLMKHKQLITSYRKYFILLANAISWLVLRLYFFLRLAFNEVISLTPKIGYWKTKQKLDLNPTYSPDSSPQGLLVLILLTPEGWKAESIWSYLVILNLGPLVTQHHTINP